MERDRRARCAGVRSAGIRDRVAPEHPRIGQETRNNAVHRGRQAGEGGRQVGVSVDDRVDVAVETCAGKGQWRLRPEERPELRHLRGGVALVEERLRLGGVVAGGRDVLKNRRVDGRHRVEVSRVGVDRGRQPGQRRIGRRELRRQRIREGLNLACVHERPVAVRRVPGALIAFDGMQQRGVQRRFHLLVIRDGDRGVLDRIVARERSRCRRTDDRHLLKIDVRRVGRNPLIVPDVAGDGFLRQYLRIAQAEGLHQLRFDVVLHRAGDRRHDALDGIQDALDGFFELDQLLERVDRRRHRLPMRAFAVGRALESRDLRARQDRHIGGDVHLKGRIEDIVDAGVEVAVLAFVEDDAVHAVAEMAARRRERNRLAVEIVAVECEHHVRRSAHVHERGAIRQARHVDDVNVYRRIERILAVVEHPRIAGYDNAGVRAKCSVGGTLKQRSELDVSVLGVNPRG